jgi:antitoxin HicB
MVAYRVLLENDDNDTLLVTCPDIPGVVTYGETREAALHHAVDAIETMLASLISHGAPVPRPKRGQRLCNNEALVKLPNLAAAKLELYWALKDAGITRAELMRRLNWKRESVDRLFRLDHTSRLDQLEAAFAALGKTVAITVTEAPRQEAPARHAGAAPR